MLKALDIHFDVIDRRVNSATAFTSVIKMNMSTGGIGIALNKPPVPEIAIVAFSVEQLHL